jgi:hypothetical protein
LPAPIGDFQAVDLDLNDNPDARWIRVDWGALASVDLMFARGRACRLGEECKQGIEVANWRLKSKRTASIMTAPRWN